MAKKSFFEKLTGTSWSEEEPEEITEEIAEEEIEEIKEKEEKNEKPEEDNKIPPVKEDIKEEAAAPSGGDGNESNEEPLTESEGQLTIDVYQNANEVIIKSTIAGVEPNDIDIKIANDMITIKGNRQKDEGVKEDDYYYQECYWGPFSRSIILPVDVESDNASASMKNGILTIKLPKVEKAKIKKIKIQPE